MSSANANNANNDDSMEATTGREHTGRWTKEEHEAFLAALQQYGKEWKKVAAKVKTRTVVQTRTHAQKYFQKLSKVLEDGSVPVGLEGGRILQGSGSLSLGSSSAAIRSASQLAEGLPKTKRASTANSIPKNNKYKAATAAAVPVVAPRQHSHVQQSISAPSNTMNAAMTNVPQQTPRTTSTAEALLNMSAFTGPIDDYTYPTNDTNTTDGDIATNEENDYSMTYNDHGFNYVSDPMSQQHYHAPSNLQIKAPNVDNSQEMKYPEPSPAACGKRKIAEITAAQMLVGVGSTGGGGGTGGGGFAEQSQEAAANNEYNAYPPSNSYGYEGYSPNPLKLRDNETNMLGCAFEEISEDDAFLAEVFGVDHPTSGVGGTGGDSGGDINVTAATVGTTNTSSRGLQIVNPDTLVSTNNRRSVYNGGMASPSTPWDGQLEALVSHVHQQEEEKVAEEAALSSTTAELDPVPDPILPPSPSSNIQNNNNTNPIPPPLRNPSNNPLSNAIASGSVTSVQSQLLHVSSSQVLQRSHNNNDDGYLSYPPLHIAAALSIVHPSSSNPPQSSEDCSVQISQLVLNAGESVMGRDKDGNVAMHWAARGGNVALVRLLLSRNCPIDSQNDANETPLHWAMRAGTRGMAVVQLLVESGARTNLYSRLYKRPLDVAAEGFRDQDNDDDRALIAVDPRASPRERRTTRWNMLRYSSQCRTLVLHHHECLDHMAKSHHDWEVPDRIDSIMSTLASRTFASCPPQDDSKFNSCEITVSNEFERATLELLSRIHSADYLAFVNELSKELDRKRKQQLLENVQNSNDSSEMSGGLSQEQHHIVPFTPMIQKKFIKEAKTKADGHSDTSFSAGSLKAARRAAGAVQHAVDCVLVGRNRNAFCVVRPPGHHAGINGLLSDAGSCGFCLFNNVAAGAMHALSDEKHRPRCERCAIVDIDAHHGNGTEEIVRKCHDSGRLLFFSVHLYDCDKPKKTNEFNYKFYPGTGADDDVPHNVINVPIAPLWREKEVIKSICTPTNGNGSAATERAQTRLKTKADSRVSSSTDLKSMSGNNEQQIGDELQNAFAAKPKSQLPTSSPHYPPHYLMGVGRLAYRRAIQHRLLPALRAFNPDLIIMSTGFDAARGDVGNARHYVNGTQAMGLDLEPEDYAWTSRKICEVADICCNGRVVSVLEGGYGRTSPSIPPPPLAEPTSSEEIRQPLEKGFFSECAMHHLKGLVDPYAE